VLGALLDLTAEVLAVMPSVRLDELPRMADFARILGALDRIRGWTTLADYNAAAAEASQAVLDGDPVADAVLGLMSRQNVWSGTASELLTRLAPEHRPPGMATDAAGRQRGTQGAGAGLACERWAHRRVPAAGAVPDHHAARGWSGTCQQREFHVALVAHVARRR
jgi:hypothetical protein